MKIVQAFTLVDDMSAGERQPILGDKEPRAPGALAPPVRGDFHHEVFQFSECHTRLEFP